ncbi:Hypothetical predicted protein [Olea europaea subsp. europaea]|uniref:Uncharacterized protein n=1 Tax=Olea europaea subsp. europaea TaxID=158383 RepID=A0A8S0PEA0_OLEEU|nr:Hypothetical predicted protein [Olea europaea subsp. europaea]
MQPDFHVFLGDFWEAICRPCSGRVWATVGMQLDFQAFLGHVQDASWPRQGRNLIFSISRQFVGTVYKQCLGRFPATLGMQADFKPNKGSSVYRLCQGRRHVPKHSGQFLGHSVQALFRTSHGHATAQPDFQAFIGSSWVTAMSGTRPDCDRNATKFLGISKQFLEHSVQAMSRAQQGRSLIFMYFSVVSGKRCTGHVQDASGPRQARNLISRHF